MDLRRGLAVLKDFSVEVAAQGIQAKLQAIQNAIAVAPSAAADTEFANQMRTLFSALDSCPSNEWPPAPKRLLQILGLAALTGMGLRRRVEDILSSSGITRTAAQQKFVELSAQAQQVYAAATQIAAGFKTLGADLEPPVLRQCETGFVIPVQENTGTLDYLDRDIDGFNKLLKTLNELMDESAISPRVTGLDTGSWEVYVELGLRATKALIDIITGILKMRKEVGTLRDKTRSLGDESGIPAEMIKKLEDIAAARVESRLAEIVQAAIEQSRVIDQARRNELRSGLSINIHFLARQLDDGVRIEITAPKQISHAEDTNPEEAQLLVSDLEYVQRQSVAIARMEENSAPVLMLTDESSLPANTLGVDSNSPRLPPAS